MASKIDDPLVIRFLLPEHAAALAEHAYESTLVPRPILEDDEMAEINSRRHAYFRARPHTL